MAHGFPSCAAHSEVIGGRSYGYRPVNRGFVHASIMERSLKETGLPESVPLDCDQARGEPDEKQGTTCWYKLPKVPNALPGMEFPE